MKKKLKLDLSDLTVESFDTTPPQARARRGTVVGLSHEPGCTQQQGCYPTIFHTCEGTCAQDQTCAATCNIDCGGSNGCGDTAYFLCSQQCGTNNCTDSDNTNCDTVCENTCAGNTCDQAVTCAASCGGACETDGCTYAACTIGATCNCT